MLLLRLLPRRVRLLSLYSRLQILVLVLIETEMYYYDLCMNCVDCYVTATCNICQSTPDG